MDKSIPNTPAPPPSTNAPVGKIINSEEVTQSILNTVTEYSPYICILLAILLIISLITHITSSSSDESESKPTYSGNKSLDQLWTDANGNNISSDARMTSQVSLSTNEYSCKFDVTYEGDDYRDVTCITGCSVGAEPEENSENKENEEFCNQYRFSAREGNPQGTMLSRFLDSEYLSNNPEFTDTPQSGEGGDEE